MISASDGDRGTGGAGRGYARRGWRLLSRHPLVVQIFGGVVAALVATAVLPMTPWKQESPPHPAPGPAGADRRTGAPPAGPVPAPPGTATPSPSRAAPEPRPAEPVTPTPAPSSSPVPSTPSVPRALPAESVPTWVKARCTGPTVCFWTGPDFTGDFHPVEMIYSNDRSCHRLGFTARSLYSNATQNQAFFPVGDCSRGRAPIYMDAGYSPVTATAFKHS